MSAHWGSRARCCAAKVGTRNLNHASLAPSFDRAAHLRVPILIHPRAPEAAVKAAYYSDFRPEVNAALAHEKAGFASDNWNRLATPAQG